MTTTIVPSSGAGALFTQQGVGTTPGYSALDVRRSEYGALQEGVYGTATLVTAGGVANTGQADFMVTQRNAGANMSVDVNMPAGGFGYVQGDTINGQALYTVPVHSSNINEAIAAADATNPRVDQVILEALDNVLDASGNNLARTRVLTGTPTGGTTLTTRAGAAALPGSALLLADILVPNASSSVPNSNIRDRRKWARGAYVRTLRNTTNYTTAVSGLTVIDGTNLSVRVECSGLPVRVILDADWFSAAAGRQIKFDLLVDAVPLALPRFDTASAVATSGQRSPMTWEFIPTAGSHALAPAFASVDNTTTLTVPASSTEPLTLVVEEVVRSSAMNNTVTTG